MSEIVEYIENLISGLLPFAVLMIAGLYFTLKGKCFQIKGLKKTVPLIIKAAKSKRKTKEFNSFSAACTALSATVGTGNIAGVAGALSIGGAGAVFWMWVAAFMGMAVKYGEISLSVIYGKGSTGGPLNYIKKGMPQTFKKLAYFFALAALPAVLCSGNITQTNAAVNSFGQNNILKYILGVVFAVLTAFVIKGGIKSVGKVTEWLVPLMAVVYIIFCVGVIFKNVNLLPEAVKMIFKGAFNPRAVTGGAVGSVFTVMFTGASRGVFSNEAGLGTSAMAHSAASDTDEKTQGLFGIFEVFLDTVVLCTLTALTILCSGVNIRYGENMSTELVGEALRLNYGGFAIQILGFMMCLFAFSSVIGWAVYGDICSTFLFGEKGRRYFKVIYPFGCIIGALCNAEIAWRCASFFNGIMLCINLPTLVYLCDDFLKNFRGDKDGKKNTENKRIFKRRSGGTNYRG